MNAVGKNISGSQQVTTFGVTDYERRGRPAGIKNPGELTKLKA